MFILANSKEGVSFKIAKKNNRTMLSYTNSIDDESLPITYTAIELRSPVQYFCFTNFVNSSLSTSLLEQASLLEMTVECEQNLIQEQDKNWEDLINEFGDKKSKERVKRRIAEPSKPTQMVRFTIENQILPEYNADAKIPADIYRVDLLFSSKALARFSEIDREASAMCPIISNANIDESNRIICNAIDCLYSVLSYRFIRRDSLPSHYSFFYDEISDGLVSKRLSPLLRDRLLAKLYVLILILSGLRVSISMIPKFECPKTHVVGILKALGCDVSSSGWVVLKRTPTEVFKRH